MSTILTDKKPSKQEQFNNWVREEIAALNFQSGVLLSNYIALKRASGITDEQISKELDKLNEEAKNLNN